MELCLQILADRGYELELEADGSVKMVAMISLSFRLSDANLIGLNASESLTEGIEKTWRKWTAPQKTRIAMKVKQS